MLRDIASRPNPAAQFAMERMLANHHSSVVFEVIELVVEMVCLCVVMKCVAGAGELSGAWRSSSNTMAA